VNNTLQVLVSVVYTDGEHEYHSQILLSSATYSDAPQLARVFLSDIFAEGTVQDRNQRNLFWSKGDTRNVRISNIRTLNDAEFDFLKHYLNVSSVQ